MTKVGLNYYETFITIAPDSAARVGVAPPSRGSAPTKAQLQHQLLSAQPYQLTQEEVLFRVHIHHKGLALQPGTAEWKRAWEEFFRKPQACLRASPLPKQYGWGLHFDKQGRIALVGCETAEYAHLASGGGGVKVVAALRSKRASR